MSSFNQLARLGGTPVLTQKEVCQSLGRWPEVTSGDVEAVTKVLCSEREPWGFLHPSVRELEDAYANLVQRRFCLAVSSGSAALHLAVAALEIEAGSEVLTPSLGFIASATCILHQNCIPVFVDVDERSFNIDPSLIEARITPRTRAIVAVDLLGLPADYNKISVIAERHGLTVISDASQSQGAMYRGRRAGGLGDISAVSIMASKNLASCGEGGLITTDSEEIAMHLIGHASHGMNPWSEASEAQRRVSHQLGFNYRPTPTSAAFANSQLKRLDAYQCAREERVRIFEEAIAEVKMFRLPAHMPDKKNAYQMYRIMVEPAALDLKPEHTIHLRDAIVFLSRAEGSLCGFWEDRTLPSMPLFQKRLGYGDGCPWRCNPEANKDYNPNDYPAAQRVIDSSFMASITRATHPIDLVKRQAEIYHKVWENRTLLRKLTLQISDAGGFKAWSGVSIHDAARLQRLTLSAS